MEMDKHKLFMQKALEQAAKALQNGEFPVGCVIVHEDRIVAVGSRENSAGLPNEMDHAEIIALRSLLNSGFAKDPAELVVYSTMEPCLMCFSTLIVNGIRTIVYAYEDAMGGGTNVPLKDLLPFYKEMNVAIIRHIMRKESLDMFVKFFQRTDNLYLHDSYLAHYTLAQHRS
jgi:tRNA(adenine34) deaminase